MNRRILLADDHPIVLDGLRRILERPGFEIAGIVHNGRDLVRAAANLSPDIIVADVSMPMLNGIEAVRQIRQFDSDVKIVFLSMHPEVIYAVEALDAGASAYVLKSAAGEELLSAIEAVNGGAAFVTPTIAAPVASALEGRAKKPRQPILTHRQSEIMQLLSEGKSVKEIAALLNISPRTVEFHKYRAMELLGVRTVAELARQATRRGMIV